jgi:hypothetical protein
MLGFVGVTSIDTNIAEVTVSGVDADTAPRVAEIIVAPGLAVVVIPFEPGVLLIAATALTEELQVAEAVMSCTELSVYTPVATKRPVRPLAKLALVGVRSITTKVAAVTLRLVEPDIFPIVAVIVVDPGLAVVARPVLPIQAAAAFAELHVTRDEMSCFEPSEYRPVAVN